MTDVPSELDSKLNRETAKIPWRELQRFYAQGAVIAVSPSLDLIHVAKAFANDDRDWVSALLENGDVSRVDESQATQWFDEDATVWAVVVAPWVLVQSQGDSQ